MYYSIEQLIKKLKKSKSTITITLDRYSIRRIIKNKVKYYDISKVDMEKIKHFLKYRSDLQEDKKYIK